MSITDNKLKNILEAALMSFGKPMSIEQMQKLFGEDEQPSVDRFTQALKELQVECEGRGIELKEIASGFRYQARQDFSEWISRLWEEKPAKYSRAYLETLALIAYRQPVTRAEIEDVRGVSVSTNTVKTMLEREWIRVVGHRDVPGRPSLYATTRQFLDYFNMKSLNELPSLAEIRDLDDLSPELELSDPDYNNMDISVSDESRDTDYPVLDDSTQIVEVSNDFEAVDDAMNELKDDKDSIALNNEHEVELEDDVEDVVYKSIMQSNSNFSDDFDSDSDQDLETDSELDKESNDDEKHNAS